MLKQEYCSDLLATFNAATASISQKDNYLTCVKLNQEPPKKEQHIIVPIIAAPVGLFLVCFVIASILESGIGPNWKWCGIKSPATTSIIITGMLSSMVVGFIGVMWIIQTFGGY